MGNEAAYVPLSSLAGFCVRRYGFTFTALATFLRLRTNPQVRHFDLRPNDGIRPKTPQEII